MRRVFGIEFLDGAQGCVYAAGGKDFTELVFVTADSDEFRAKYDYEEFAKTRGECISNSVSNVESSIKSCMAAMIIDMSLDTILLTAEAGVARAIHETALPESMMSEEDIANYGKSFSTTIVETMRDIIIKSCEETDGGC